MFTNQNENDNFMTPSYVWDLIIPFIPKDLKIWEAFYGDGESGKYLTSKGFDVIHNDIDFFENNHGEIIVTNCPFSIKKEVFTSGVPRHIYTCPRSTTHPTPLRLTLYPMYQCR
mgnify:CR=1 FL=1